MKKNVILASVLLALSQAAIAADCAYNFVNGVAPAFINDKLNERGHQLCYEAYSVFASGLTKTPLWSAEHLSRESLYLAGQLKRVDSFHSDDNLPYEDRAELHDYARSGLDRGHMAPNGDMPTVTAQSESFSLANIVPQNGPLNRGLWSDIESSVRSRAKSVGELYVVTGPAFVSKGAELDTLKGRVFVPTHIWKAVYDPKTNQAGVFWVRNTEFATQETISLEQLKSLTGIDVFPQLPAKVKKTAMDLSFAENSKFEHKYRYHREIANLIKKQFF